MACSRRYAVLGFSGQSAANLAVSLLHSLTSCHAKLTDVPYCVAVCGPPLFWRAGNLFVGDALLVINNNCRF